MVDKKLFTTFIILTSVLNFFLVYQLITGLSYYLNNIQNIQNNEKQVQDFNQIFDEFSVKTSIPRKDLTILRDRFSSTTSIAGYIEKLSFKTNEKNVQIFKTSVLSTTENEITMELTLFGSLNSVTNVIREIEEELPLTEITSSSIERSGKLVKANLNIRILIEN